MPTATPRKTTSALDQLEALEAAHQDAAQHASDLASDQWTRTCKLNGTPGHDAPGLLAQFNRLWQNQPDLFHSDRTPVDPDSPAGRLAHEIDTTAAGLDDLNQQVDHARRLEARKRQGVEEHVRGNLDAILAALEAEGTEHVTAVQANIDAARRAAGDYLDYAKRIMGLVAAARGDTRRVTAFDTGSELVRQLDGWTADLPNPARLR